MAKKTEQGPNSESKRHHFTRTDPYPGGPRCVEGSRGLDKIGKNPIEFLTEKQLRVLYEADFHDPETQTKVDEWIIALSGKDWPEEFGNLPDFLKAVDSLVESGAYSFDDYSDLKDSEGTEK